MNILSWQAVYPPPLHLVNDQSLKYPGGRPLKCTRRGWRGGEVSCFDVRDSFVEVSGGLIWFLNMHSNQYVSDGGVDGGESRYIHTLLFSV